jgi:hypothetical protein
VITFPCHFIFGAFNSYGFTDFRDEKDNDASKLYIEDYMTNEGIAREFCVSVRRPPPNGAVSGLLVFPIDSGHLGALYGCEAEETALAE